MGSKKASSEGQDVVVEVAAERAAVERWAEEAGHLPQFLGTTSLGTARGNPAYWKFAATKALMGWKDGEEMTKAQYEAAVAEQDAIRHG